MAASFCIFTVHNWGHCVRAFEMGPQNLVLELKNKFSFRDKKVSYKPLFAKYYVNFFITKAHQDFIL